MKKSKVIFLAVLACAFGASARTVTQDEATRAARLWAVRGMRLGTRVGGLVRNVVEYNTNSLPAFYAVEFSNGGTVFTSADTENEPILAFARDATSKLDKNSPLAALLYGRTAKKTDSSANRGKWNKVLSARTIRLSASANAFLGTSETPIEGIDEIDDVRVAPLTKTKWDQAESYSKSNETAAVTCYDYYTPTCRVVTCYADLITKTNDPAHQVCGCVATAMAQVMKYWEFPQGERISFTNEYCQSQKGEQYACYNLDGSVNESKSKFTDKTPITLYTESGAYDWANMTQQPLAYYNEQWSGTPVTEENRQAIGKLTYDCGVAVGMNYGISAVGGSSISTTESQNIADALMARFDYTNALLNAAYAPLSSKSVSAARQKTILANLDAGCPVIMLITGDGGHAVVGDGYGYSGEEEDAYVHLNMGWSGQNDVWYNLPLIKTGSNPESFSGFNTIIGVVYNVFPTNAGEIVSGHVTTNDVDGVAHPVPNLVVTVTDDLGAVYEATTSECGVYALLVPADRSYRVYAELPAEGDKKIGETFTGLVSASSGSSVGNSWGNDLKMDYPTVRIGDVPYVSLDRALEEVTDGDTVEVLRPVELRRPVTITNDCTIVATNDNAEASAITPLDGSQLEVADGVAVSISNVAFAVEYERTIIVSEGGELRVGGYCELGSVWTSTPDNLVVASVLEHAFAVNCAGAAGLNQTFACGADDLDYLTASNCANKMLHYTNTRWGGEAWTRAGKVFFRWSNKALVPDEAAVAKLVADGASRNYRAVDDILEDLEDATGTNEIAIVKDGSFARPYGVGADCCLFLHGLGDVQPVLVPGSRSGFTIEADGSLIVSNLVFSGFDASIEDGKSFIEVDGGELTLADGAVLDGIIGRVDYCSGVVDLFSGMVTMLDGSAIVNCSAQGANRAMGQGGAIYAEGTDGNSALNLWGGTIANCCAVSFGGGVYVDAYDYEGEPFNYVDVSIQGPLVVSNNFSSVSDKSAGMPDDVYLLHRDELPYFKLTGELSGRVGIRYSAAAMTGNDEDDAFMANAVGTVSQDTLDAFFCDADDTLVAVTNKNGFLAWKKTIDDGTVEHEEDGAAHVYRLDGNGNVLSVKHYYDLVTALDYMEPGTANRIEMYIADYNGEYLYADVEIPSGCQVVLTARKPDGYCFYRNGDVGILIPEDASLTLTNVTFDVNVTATKPYFEVDGGELTLAAGASLYSCRGGKRRDANGITVHSGGVFTMLSGSAICHCSNYYNDDTADASESSQHHGVGGGLLLEGATAYLHGGNIYGCRAARGGGVCASSGSKVYVSGSVEITDSTGLGGEDSNLLIEDLSELCLDGVLTGKIGTGDTIAWVSDTNLVAYVDYVWTNSVEALAASATNFTHDVTGDIGVAVTNGTKALIVWCGAVKDGLFTNAADKLVYALAGEMPTVVRPVALLPPLTSSAAVTAELTKLSDPAVAEKITTLEEYNEFCAWADGVEGGKDAVAASPNAYVSYEFGTSVLFESEPTVEITEITSVANGLAFCITVKDGEDPVAVASDKVADLVEATSDVGDWSAKLDLTVNDLTQTHATVVRFVVKPAGSPTQVFIRLKY